MKIGLVCQYFPPEVAPIGVMLSELATDLGRAGHEVTVFTGYPNHPEGRLFDGFKRRFPGHTCRAREGYRIRRNWIYINRSKKPFSRVLNYLSFALFAGVSCAASRQDVYLLVSPPLSNVVLGMFMRLVGLRYILNIQDIYPDAAVTAGMIRNKLLIRALVGLESAGYHFAKHITVISAGFARNLQDKGVPRSKISTIPNWIDLEEITPRSRINPFSTVHALSDKFTVLYSGTIGLVSGAEIVLDLAKLLASESDIVVMIVGEGVVKARLEAEARRQGLPNVRFAPFQPRSALGDVLASASVGLVTLKPGHGRNSVPSKILGYLAAERPVIASVDPDSDTWNFVDESRCGVCVCPGDASGLASAVRRLAADSELAGQLGRNGRRYLERNLARHTITAEYEKCLRQCI